MRAFFLLLFAVLSCHTAYGQTIVNLTVSNDKEKHVSNIPVKIIACDSLFTHTTGMDGQVSFTILSPDCRRVKVLIKSKFYENLDTTIYVDEASANHHITIHSKVQKIKQVEVVAYRRIAKNNAEKSVYQIDTHGLLKTTNAEKALSFLPGLVADNGSYTLTGQSRKCRIKIDGREATSEELKAINAKDILRVEVREMTKDDDSGTAGEINVIKRRVQQPKVYTHLSAWTGVLRPQIGTYDNFAYQSKRWDIIASLNLVRHTIQSESNVTRYFNSQPMQPQQLSLSRTIKTVQNAEHIKINFFATDKLTLTASAYHSGYPSDATDSGKDFSGHSYLRTSNEKIDHSGGYANMGYKWNERNTLTLKGNY